jgi:hypothetical protein
MKGLLRCSLALLVAVTLWNAPVAEAQYDGCYVCKTIYLSDGSTLMSCVTPPPVMFGAEFCFIDDDPWLYCQTWGNSCCMDPW